MTHLKEIRSKRNFSQSELADFSGVSVRMIQNYEQGTKDINKAAAITVYRLARALGITVEQLLDTTVLS